jgi:hypothetical protein
MIRRLASIPCWQIAACLIGIVACATPCDVIHRGFWEYHYSVYGLDPEGTRIERIEPNTPAASLYEKDRIVAINGKEIVSCDGVDQAWRDAPVGSEVEFRVQRGEPVEDDEARRAAEVVVHIRRVADPVAASIYWHWQIVAGIGFLALGVVVLLTYRFQCAATWPRLVVVLGSSALFALILFHKWGTWSIVRHGIILGPWSEFQHFGWQKGLALGACIALLLCSVVDGFLGQRSRPG